MTHNDWRSAVVQVLLLPILTSLSLLQVSVDVPDVKGREEILKVHARNKKLLPDVELEQVAMRTPGFSGADLANLLNEAAILTGRRNLQGISNKARSIQQSVSGCCSITVEAAV